MPKRPYNNRQMETEAPALLEQTFFFPKANPPVSIVAFTREEAEEKLAAKK